MMQELLLSTNAPCMSCLPQRSYTLIVEALDFNNETSGKYFSLSGISILPSVHFFFFFFLFFFLSPCHSSAWEEFRWRSGKEVDSSWTPLPTSTWSTGWFCVCVCVQVCWQVATGRRWVKGSKRKKMGLGRAVRVEEGCPPPFPFLFFFFFFKTTEPRCSPNRKNIFIWLMTDGGCCQPGSGSHCLTVTEAWNIVHPADQLEALTGV